MSHARQLTRAAAITAAVALAGCLTAGEATRPGTKPAPSTALGPLAPTPAERAAQDLIQRFRTESRIDRQRREHMAQRRFEAGLADLEAGAFREAYKQFQRAIELDPGHQEAHVQFHKARGLLDLKDGRGGLSIGHYLDERRVSIELRKAELATRFATAKALYAKGQFADAAQALTQVGALARYLSPHVDCAKVAEEAEVLIQRCLAAIDDQRRKEAEERQRRAKELSDRLRERRSQALGQRAQALLARARGLQRQHRYGAARAICDQILTDDPSHGPAQALRDSVVEAARRVELDRALQARAVEMARHWDHTRALCAPQFDLVSISPQRLAYLRTLKAPVDVGGRVDQPPEWENRIREGMGKKISFDFVETPLQDVISFMSSLVGVTIVLDTEALGDAVPNVTLRVNDMRFESALGWICKLVGLHYGLRDEAVYISNRLHQKPELRMYDISDITINITHFKGRQAALSTGGGMNSTGSVGPSDDFAKDFFPDEDEDDDDDDTMTGQKLVEFIKRTIAPGTWIDDEGGEGFGIAEEW